MKCAVHGCESDALHLLHKMRERQGWADYPMEVAVCGVHRDELSDPDTRWTLISDIDGRELRVGTSQRALNEFVVLEPPTQALGYGSGRDVSHPEDNGLHFPLAVRQRGKDPETITLVMAPDKLTAFADFLQAVAEPLRRPPGQS